jgi:hypothetical protein
MCEADTWFGNGISPRRRGGAEKGRKARGDFDGFVQPFIASALAPLGQSYLGSLGCGRRETILEKQNPNVARSVSAVADGSGTGVTVVWKTS